jgi:Domain of unknown function (DUF4145)
VFRKLTPQNWTERDPTNEIFAMRGSLGMRLMSGNDWADLFLGIEISASVAKDVRHLFEVARNTLLYGHFFYPLYTVGSEQLYRVADASALHRYRDLGGPKTKKGHDATFAARIQWLREHGAIADEHADLWQRLREGRNDASHPKMQPLVTPGNALGVIHNVAECVSVLYAPPTVRPPEDHRAS